MNCHPLLTSRAGTASVLGAILASVLWAQAAVASDTFPAVIQRELALTSPPACTLCHAGLQGGTGTVVTPFGLSMQDFGAREKDPASLERALRADRDSDLDSDGDGIADTAELTFGSDPNDGPGRVNAVARPQHGCTLSQRTGRERVALPLASALGVALLVTARRRARHAKR